MARIILQHPEIHGGPDALPAVWARQFATKMSIKETLQIAECFAPDLPEVAQ